MNDYDSGDLEDEGCSGYFGEIERGSTALDKPTVVEFVQIRNA